MYDGKKFGVFGLGLSGIATIDYLNKKNIEFIAFDDSLESISRISSNRPELANNLKDLSGDSWNKIDYLILSPGISLTYPKPHPIVEMANKINAKIICDIELFYLDNKDNYYIGITGTNGKSTTTALIGHILQYNKVNAVVGGNIGVPVLSLDSKEKNVFIFEVSSFQLDLLNKTKFNIALLMNISPDHLDRHGSFENYKESKYKIFNNQAPKDKAIINIDLAKVNEAITFSEIKEADFIVKDNILYFGGKCYDIPFNNSLIGKHNQQNLSAAIACCFTYGLSIEQIIESIPSFVGLKHRMQYLGEYNGVKFINDSKATNADSTSKALASFDNIIWIVGGVEKEGGIEPLKEYFPKIKKALLIGASQENFAKTLSNEVSWEKCDNLNNAFNIACKIASSSDVILLSPACASYDQWKNFEARGDAFIELVKNYN